MRPSKRASNSVQMDAKKPGQEADTPALLAWLLLDCETVLPHKRPCGPLVTPAETAHPLRVCAVSVGQIMFTIPLLRFDLSAFRFRSIPFRRLCRLSSKGGGRGKYRKGMGN